jgi:hypothetical protein
MAVPTDIWCACPGIASLDDQLISKTKGADEGRLTSLEGAFRTCCAWFISGVPTRQVLLLPKGRNARSGCCNESGQNLLHTDDGPCLGIRRKIKAEVGGERNDLPHSCGGQGGEIAEVRDMHRVCTLGESLAGWTGHLPAVPTDRF